MARKSNLIGIILVLISLSLIGLVSSLEVIIEPLEPGVTIIQNQTTISADDTNATTACPDDEFLRGDGTCQSFASAGDTNETNRFQNLTTYDCQSGFVVQSIQNNGTVFCVADANTGGGNIFDQELNSTQNVSFGNVTSSSWFNGLFNWTLTTVGELYLTFTGGVLDFDEAQLNATIDDRLIANETNRFQNLTSYDCQVGFVMNGTYNNGTASCIADADSGAINIFDQELNTTESPTFGNLTITRNLTVFGNASINTFTARRYLAFPPNGIGFNFYDDGSELFLNSSEAEAFNIETESAKLILFNEPKTQNDFKLFQVFNKMATLETEFVVTQAGPELASYFIRSLSLSGNNSVITSPHNCSTFAQFIDCGTDLTGPDFFVLDDIELNGTIYIQEAVRANDWTNVSITEEQISDLVHTGSANETNRFQNLTTYACQGTDKVLSIANNGTIECGADVDTISDLDLADFQASFDLNITDFGGGATSWLFASNLIYNDTSTLRFGVANVTPVIWTMQVDGNVSLNQSLFVNTNGFVGIGTSSPDKLLDVSGENSEVIFQDETGNEIALIFQSLEASFIFDIITQKSSSNTAARSLRFHQGTTESLSLGSSIIRFNNDQADMDFIVEAVGTSNALFVQGSDGFVGIGNNAPGALLDVAGTAIIDNDMSIGRGSLIANVRLTIQEANSQTTDMVRIIQGGTGDVLIGFVKSLGVDWIMGEDATTGDFKISEGLNIAANERFTIQNATGNIGINSGNPAHTLTVDGNMNITGAGNCIIFDSGGQICSGS